MKQSPLAVVSVATYNQASMIRQCLDSIISQKTTFPYLVVVHDDASTDGTTEIVREYEATHPHLIQAIYETENQYSKLPNALYTFIEQTTKGRATYVALCEGDDYWTAPDKLQLQIDFLESHPEYSMVCSDCSVITPQGELDWKRYEEDSDITPEAMISGGGGYICTPSIVYRNSIMEHYPEECKRCTPADFPLQIFAVLNGKVRYIARKLAAYRFMHEHSWGASQAALFSPAKISIWHNFYDMMRHMDTYSTKKYHQVFRAYISQSIMSTYVDCGRYLYAMHGEIIRNWSYMTPKAKLLYYLFKSRIPAMFKYLKHLIFKH